MTPDRWKQIEIIFNAAIELPAVGREAFLSNACGDDLELRHEVERLLNLDEQAGTFIETPPPVPDLANLNSDFTAESDWQSSLPTTGQMIGKKIGAYRLEQELGRGGMGAVYLASRADNEFQRLVAIKLLKRGMDTDLIVRRFRHERQILASFDHPNIARLIDGGTTNEGLPYFVMEYIEGAPITRWCDDRRLSITERLRLFLQVCAAVQYAHQRQVIHRDIKPGNILVTANGVPKLLDFGIAKILNPDLLHDSEEVTITGIHPMTPEYASPEQARGEMISAASDQYSLGVLLYELLTGRRPYRLRQRMLHEMARVICEEIPEKPSEVITHTDEITSGGELKRLTPEFISLHRSALPEELQAQLDSGPDAIVMKALHKLPLRRYESVSQFADDINHYLNGQPIIAPPVITLNDDPFATELLDITPTPHSIAILPLKSLYGAGGEADTGSFLSIGLADSLITRLSNIRSLTVRPTASVIKYSRVETDAVTAGKELKVSHVLDGRFLQSGERIRVTVQLINVRTAAPQWAAQFDERADDLLKLQDSLSEQVVHEIARNLTGDEREKIVKRGTNDPQAYQAYLRGRYHWHTYTDDGLARAITSFYEAIAIDPKFAAAYTGVADYFNWMGLTATLPPDECFRAAKEAARTAIQLDDKLAEAYTSLAIATWAYDWDTATGSQLMRRAIELNKNYAQAHEWLAHFRSAQGRHVEAIHAMNRALEINPQSPALHAMMSFILHNADENEEAYRYCQRALQIQPNYYLALQAMAWLYPHAGTAAEAIAACHKAIESTGRTPLALWALGHTLAVAGQRDEARAVIQELADLSQRRYVPNYFFVRIHTALGEFDQAFERLNQSLDDHESWVQELPVDPQLDPIRNDPRFAECLARLRPRNAPAVTSELKSPTAQLSSTSLPEPEPIQKKEPDCLPAESNTGWKAILRTVAVPVIVLAIIGVIALFALLRPYFWQKSSKPATSSSATKTMAVLPFKTSSTSERDQLLSMGLSDALASRLSQLRQLSVRPGSAMRHYLNGGFSAQQIAAEQSVDYVVSGTLRRQNKQLDLDVQMFDARENRVVMQAELIGLETGLSNLQNALAERVLRELKFEVTGNELLQLTRRYTDNNDAYQLYLMARYHMGNRSVAGLNQAINEFSQAVELDDQFAPAYAGLADSYALLNLYAAPPPRDAMERARVNALKALKLDDQLAEPHASLAYVKFWFDRDRSGAMQEIKRAIDLNPNYVTAHHWSGLMLSAMGRFDEAKAAIRKAQELDPRSTILHSAAAMICFYAREYDQAIVLSRHALELDSGLVPAHKVQRWIYLTTGRYDEAKAAYEQEKSFSGDAEHDWPTILAQLQAINQQPDLARENIQRALDSDVFKREPGFLLYEIAIAYALLGDKDQAFNYLKKADLARVHSFNFLTVDPRLDKLRDDPRFAAMTNQAGFR